MKLVVDRETPGVVGAHMVGADAAGDHPGHRHRGARRAPTKAQFDRTIGIHPTAAEEFVTLRDKVPEAAAPVIQGRAAE